MNFPFVLALLAQAALFNVVAPVSSISALEHSQDKDAHQPEISNYSNLTAPATLNSPTIFVFVRLHIREVVDVDTIQEVKIKEVKSFF